MKRVKWDLEEAVVLLDFYIKSGCTLNINRDKLEELSLVLNKRAKIKGIVVDEKFRNISGLSMQIGCIHYIATDGKEGFSNASKIFLRLMSYLKVIQLNLIVLRKIFIKNIADHIVFVI
mgnify:CR=1 FL=1